MLLAVELLMLIVKLGGEGALLLCLAIWIVSIDILEVEYKHMPPMAALEYVRSIRPRVLLAQSQWKAVQEYGGRQHTTAVNSASGDVVLIAKADLERYHATCDNGGAGKEQVVLPRIKARPPVMARLSCLFACLKVSGVLVPIIGQLPDARAC